MPVNKNALLRYQTIDRCLRNTGRGYTFKELHEAVDSALNNEGAIKGISVRQLREDLRFMRSEDGYNAPVETKGRGAETIYYYDDTTFSINNSPINATELQQLKSALKILGRLDGSPEFEWMEGLSLKLLDRVERENEDKKVIGHDTNPDYKGYEHIRQLFNAIINQRVLKIVYTSYSGQKFAFNFHPYFLKEYNKRWFVFGFNESNDHHQWNVPLDRIDSLTESSSRYKKDRTDWEDYFYDMIGVTRLPEQKPEEVVLRFERLFAPYVITKPIHASQRPPVEDEKGVLIRLKVIRNKELEAVINGYGDQVEVLAPNELRESMKKQANRLLGKYLHD